YGGRAGGARQGHGVQPARGHSSSGLRLGLIDAAMAITRGPASRLPMACGTFGALGARTMPPARQKMPNHHSPVLIVSGMRPSPAPFDEGGDSFVRQGFSLQQSGGDAANLRPALCDESAGAVAQSLLVRLPSVVADEPRPRRADGLEVVFHVVFIVHRP